MTVFQNLIHITFDHKSKQRLALPSMLMAVLIAAISLAWIKPAHTQVTAADTNQEDWRNITVDGQQIFTRVVRDFDFEERQRGNFNPLPENWSRIENDNFPHYAEARMVQDIGDNSESSLMLFGNGANASVILSDGIIPALSNAVYLVNARVKTKDMTHARVRMVAYYINQKKEIIEESIKHSRLVRSNKEWTDLNIRLSHQFENAAWIVLRLEVIQPKIYHNERSLNSSKVKQFQVNQTDLRGRAYIDNVNVLLAPQTRLRTQSVTNIIRSPAMPVITANVRDYTLSDVKAVLNVYDINNKLIKSYERPINKYAPAEWAFRPELPGYGWYYANLKVMVGNNVVGRDNHSFAYMPNTNNMLRGMRDRFVIQAENLPKIYNDTLSDMLNESRAGAVTLSAWRYGDLVDSNLKESDMERLVKRLYRDKFNLTLAVNVLPNKVASELESNPDNALALIQADDTFLNRYLAPMLDRYGRQVEKWQIGSSGNLTAFQDVNLQQNMTRFMAYMDERIASPTVSVPWPISHELPSQRPPSAFLVNVPTSIPPNYIVTRRLDTPRKDQPEFVTGFEEIYRYRRDNITLLLETLNPLRYNHKQRTEDLALRMVYGWMSNPESMAINRPWFIRAEDGNHSILPDPIMPVFANMTDKLAGRKFFGKIRLQPGVETYVLEGQGSDGALVVWRNQSLDTTIQLDELIGENLTITDIWGNQKSLTAEDGKYTIEVNSMPQFIEGIDVKLAKFLAGFRITPQLIISDQGFHQHQLRIYNPYGRAISGILTFTEPDNWRFVELIQRFQITSDAQIALPFRIAIPLNQNTGPTEIKADIRLETPEGNFDMELSTMVVVGIEGIDVFSTVNVVNGNDLEVLLTVQNKSDRQYSFNMYGNVPVEHPTQYDVLVGLQPGRSIIKRFIFRNQGNLPSGSEISIKFREMNGRHFLNVPVIVP